MPLRTMTDFDNELTIPGVSTRTLYKVIRQYVKNEKHNKTLARTHVLHIHSSFVSCFTSAQCDRNRQHGQNQANTRILPAPQHVAVHRVDCSCYSIFHVIDICWKWWNTNFVFNIPPQEKATLSEDRASGRPSAESEVFSTSTTNPSLRHVLIQISSNT